MTNKEKYKQAFSVLHPSGKLSVEVDNMMIRKKTKGLQAAAAATAACLLFAGGSGIAYAADIGGIQRTIQLWIDGDQTTAVFEYDGNGTYVIHVDGNENGMENEIGGGGIAVGDDGSERPLTEQELMDTFNDPYVVYQEDGTVWVIYYDQKIEITDRFEDGVCYVKLSHGEETLYMTVVYQDSWYTSPHKYQKPE